MMKSNLTTYPTAYASPFSGSCFCSWLLLPPPPTHTHRHAFVLCFLGRIDLKQKYNLKLNIMRTILLCTLLALGVMQAWGVGMTEENPSRSSKMSAFKEYVVERTLSQHLSLLRQDYEAFKHEMFVYTDTLSHTLPCKLMVTLSKRGRIKDCRVEGEVCPPLAGRIKRIALNYSVSILEKEALDAQAKNEIAVDLLIPFSGNYVFLDTGLEDLVNFVRRFWRDMERFNPYGGLLSGKLRMGFIVREDGLMDGFQRMLDSIFPDYAYENYMRWFKFGRLPGGDINVAVVDGKVIPVWVVADYDFDAMTMGFKCYMIKEENE